MRASRGVALELPAWARISGHEVGRGAGERATGASRGSSACAAARPPGSWRGAAAAGAPGAGEDGTCTSADAGRPSIRRRRAPIRQRGLVPLGARGAGGPPHHWQLSERDALWAAELAGLADRAAAQWDATSDIPWEAAAGLAPDVERAVAQVMTYIAQNEYAASTCPRATCPRSTRPTPRC